MSFLNNLEIILDGIDFVNRPAMVPGQLDYERNSNQPDTPQMVGSDNEIAMINGDTSPNNMTTMPNVSDLEIAKARSPIQANAYKNSVDKNTETDTFPLESFTGTSAVAIPPSPYSINGEEEDDEDETPEDQMKRRKPLVTETEFAGGDYSPGDYQMPSAEGNGVADRKPTRSKVGATKTELTNMGKEWPRKHKDTAAMCDVDEDGVEHKPQGVHVSRHGEPTDGHQTELGHNWPDQPKNGGGGIAEPFDGTRWSDGGLLKGGSGQDEFNIDNSDDNGPRGGTKNEWSPERIGKLLGEDVNLQNLFDSYAHSTSLVCLEDFLLLCAAHGVDAVLNESSLVTLMKNNRDYIFYEGVDANGSYWTPTPFSKKQQLNEFQIRSPEAETSEFPGSYDRDEGVAPSGYDENVDRMGFGMGGDGGGGGNIDPMGMGDELGGEMGGENEPFDDMTPWENEGEGMSFEGGKMGMGDMPMGGGELDDALSVEPHDEFGGQDELDFDLDPYGPNGSQDTNFENDDDSSFVPSSEMGGGSMDELGSTADELDAFGQSDEGAFPNGIGPRGQFGSGGDDSEDDAVNQFYSDPTWKNQVDDVDATRQGQIRSPAQFESIRKFMTSAKRLLNCGENYSRKAIAEALNHSWDYYAGNVDANRCPKKIRESLSKLVQQFPGFSPIVENDAMTPPDGTSIGKSGGSNNHSKWLADQPHEMEEKHAKNVLNRQPKNDSGVTPIMKGTEKSSGESVQENISRLSKHVKKSLREAVKGIRGRYSVSYSTVVTEGKVKGKKKKTKTPPRKDLAEALADAEEVLQFHNPRDVNFEASYSDSTGCMILKHDVPMLTIGARGPIMAEGRMIFRFGRTAERFANELVSEGKTCKIVNHNWGKAVIAKVPYSVAVKAFRSIS